MKLKYTFFAILAFIPLLTTAQNVINPDGYNIFYYENGQKSSEGIMHDGNPDGYWKTYYQNGNLKSEGDRKNAMLDSIWIFYTETGDTLQKINYRYGKKNGYSYTFQPTNPNDNTLTNSVIAKELYLNNLLQGQSYYYYPNGALQKLVNYKDNKKEGRTYEFSPDSLLTSICEYRHDYLTDKEKINRRDNQNRKQGVWKTFYEDWKIETEAFYIDNQLNGYFKEYDAQGKLIRAIQYDHGKEIKEEEVPTDEKPIVKESFHSNGTIKSSGTYRKGVPVGIHREYSEAGEVEEAKMFDQFGNLESLGIVNQEGSREGAWKHYHETGELYAEGEYKNNRRTGDWKFYYKSGKPEQKGKYRNGQPEGTWTWYYEAGELRRTEEFVNGEEDGQYLELSIDVDTVAIGNYIAGEKEGLWTYKIGDEIEAGTYQAGLKNGVWKQHYKDGTIKHTGEYIQGMKHGKHKDYYPNGTLQLESFYVMDRKDKLWRYFDENGFLKMTIQYKKDTEIKIDGRKIADPNSDRSQRY